MLEAGNCIHQTSDAGYIVTGIANSMWWLHSEALLLKTNSSGDILWSKTFFEWSNSEGISICDTDDGGYIITGYINGYEDLLLIKTDASGDTLWSKIYDGYDFAVGQSVQQTFYGGYIICGSKRGPFGLPEDVWLIKTNATGDTLWTSAYGESGRDWSNSVQQTTDGGYIICGYTDSFGNGHGDIWLIKLAPDLDAWRLQSSGVTKKLLGVNFTDASTGTAVGEGGTILRTTNGGATWDSLFIGTENHLWDVHFVDTNTGTVVGDNGTIFRTTNGGATWDSLSSSTANSLMDVSFIDASTGTAVGWEGTILRTTNGGDSWMPQTSGTDTVLFRGKIFLEFADVIYQLPTIPIFVLKLI